MVKRRAVAAGWLGQLLALGLVAPTAALSLAPAERAVTILAEAPFALDVELVNESDDTVTVVEPSPLLGSLARRLVDGPLAGRPPAEHICPVFAAEPRQTIELAPAERWPVSVPFVGGLPVGRHVVVVEYRSWPVRGWAVRPAEVLTAVAPAIAVNAVEPARAEDRAALAMWREYRAAQALASDADWAIGRDPVEVRRDLEQRRIDLIRAHPDSPYADRARESLLATYRDPRRDDEAIRLCRELLEPARRYPLAETIRWRLANLLQRTGDTAGALAVLAETTTHRAWAAWLAERWRQAAEARP